jgi:isopentenyldiphosphate isomerase/intracellular septation protein A
MALNKKTIFKNFTLGFLPLLVFIIADEFFGLTTGLITAIVFGILQFLFTFIKEKRLDLFILSDTGLIILLGLISLSFKNEIFFKIKPGLIELILLILLAMTAFSNNPILIRMTGRYIKDIHFTPQQIDYLQNIMRKLFYIITIHTLLIFYSAFYMSKGVWAFISGGLFYIIMASIFLYEFIKTKMTQYKLKHSLRNDEWFDIVAPDGNIVGKAPRKAVHGNPELLHPVVHVHIINSKNDIYLQKRVMSKDIQPGKWDTAIGGHINSGETIEHAMHREAEEELGISHGQYQPAFRYIMRNEIESELVYGFLLEDDGPFFPNPKEISEGKFWKIGEIKNSIGKKIFTPNFEDEFKILLRILNKE